MGLFEAAVTPCVDLFPLNQGMLADEALSGLTLMTGFWYTRKEIPLRQCIW